MKKGKVLGVGMSLVTVAALLFYMGWRIFFTLPDYRIYGWVAFFAGICLVAAEGLSVMEALLHYWDLNHHFIPPMPSIPKEWFPEVDVLIATHNEEEELLFKTINACVHMKYPDKKKVHIHICDDTSRPEMKALAEKFKVNYLGLSDNKQAKAGNMNHAIANTKAPLIVTFDADMIPSSDFLLETIPYFFLPKMKRLEDGTWVERKEEEIDKDFKIGFIQIPQSFYNPDLFQYNLFSERKIPNEQDYFFRQVNVGKNASNAPIYAGSNTVIAREALEKVGGISTGTITEDFETGLKIEMEGYTCYAVDKLLAKGLAPITILSLIQQRERWARGCIYSLRRMHLLLNPKINLKIKMSYLACRIYWGSFTRRFLYILAPVLFAVFHIPVVICNLKGLLFIWFPSYILYGITLKRISGNIRNTRWSNIIDTTIFPYLLIPIWAEIWCIRKKEFQVTNKKKGQQESTFYLALPHIVLLILSIYSIFLMIKDLILYQAFGSLVVIYWLLVNSGGLIMAIFFMTGRNNQRMAERFLVDVPLEICYKEQTYNGKVVDISDGGFAFFMEKAIYLSHSPEDEITFYLQDREYYVKVLGRIVSVKEIKNKEGNFWKYCVIISEPDFANKQEYMQIIYDREHSLPKTLSRSSNYVVDFASNLTRRTRPEQYRKISKRKLARIKVGQVYDLKNGKKVLIENYNFEYIRLSALDLTPEGILPDNLTLFEGSSYEMICKKSHINPHVYKIVNQKELEQNPKFCKLVEEWRVGK